MYGLILGAALYRQIGLRSFWELLTEASLMSGMIFFTFSGATIFSWASKTATVPRSNE